MTSITACIYKITNKLDGKIYIGSTYSFRKRRREHLSTLKANTHSNRHLQNAFNKYGRENFSISIVEHVKKEEELIPAEQRYLDEIKPYIDAIGYNISRSAHTNRIFGEDNHHYGVPKTEEHKEKISQSLMGHPVTADTREKISRSLKGKYVGEDNWLYGRERTPETIEKWKRSMAGRFVSEDNPFYGKKHTAETKKKMGIPVVQLSKEGDFIAEFYSAAEAGRVLGIGYRHISSCCTGKRKTTGGFRWMYARNYYSQP